MKMKNKLIYLEEKDRAKEELKQSVKAYVDLLKKHKELKTEFNELKKENKQLQKNRDKAIEFGNGLLIGEATFEEIHIANRFLNILKGGSDEI